MGGKFSKKKGYSANKAKGTRTEEEGTLKETETQKSDGAPTSDSKHSSPEAAPSSKETPSATEAPSSMPKAQAPVAPGAPTALQMRSNLRPQANSVQTIGLKSNKDSLWRKKNTANQ
uniref:Brain acid soluble protein 1 n=2 Tax=Sus scrofa TaxID=9823 RepID=A0A8D1YC84_PIG